MQWKKVWGKQKPSDTDTGVNMNGELRKAKADLAKLGKKKLEAALEDCLLDPVDIEIIRRRLIGRESYVGISMGMQGYTPEAVGKRYRAAVKTLQAVAEQNGYFSGSFPGETVK